MSWGWDVGVVIYDLGPEIPSAPVHVLSSLVYIRTCIHQELSPHLCKLAFHCAPNNLGQLLQLIFLILSLDIRLKMSQKSDDLPLDMKPADSTMTLNEGGKVEAAENDLYIDPEKENKLLAKLDLFLTPVIMLVYLCCFLDRSNIGIWISLHSVYFSNRSQAMSRWLVCQKQSVQLQISSPQLYLYFTPPM
jgi:hypothetical protein